MRRKKEDAAGWLDQAFRDAHEKYEQIPALLGGGAGERPARLAAAERAVIEASVAEYEHQQRPGWGWDVDAHSALANRRREAVAALLAEHERARGGG